MSPLSQNQETTDGSQSFQAGRDIAEVNVTNVYGPSVTEVRLLVDTFVQNQLPVMREAARLEAEKNVRNFLEVFVSKLNNSKTASAKEFSRPDTQSTFQEAVKGCALRGSEIDVELVSKILVERLSATEKPLLKLVCEEAVRALPNLTRNHISYLAFLQYTTAVRHTTFTNLAQLENVHRKIMPLVADGFGITEANRKYLASLGVVTINSVANANTLPGNMRNHYPFMPATDEELEAQGAPCIARFLKEFETIGPTVFLTASGQLIGMQHLASIFDSVDMEIWIK